MKFENVGIEGMAYSLPSEAVSSIQLEQRLAPFTKGSISDLED